MRRRRRIHFRRWRSTTRQCRPHATDVSRDVSFLDIFAGPKQTTLAAGELIERVRLSRLPRPADRQLFRKVGTRAAQAISKVVVAGLLWLDRDGRIDEVRFAVGSVAPTVRRLFVAEGFLRGQRPTPDVIAHAVSLVPNDISPIDDIRSTAEYRLLVTTRLFEQFLSDDPLSPLAGRGLG